MPTIDLVDETFVVADRGVLASAVAEAAASLRLLGVSPGDVVTIVDVNTVGTVNFPKTAYSISIGTMAFGRAASPIPAYWAASRRSL